jgi:hypothetical protein
LFGLCDDSAQAKLSFPFNLMEALKFWRRNHLNNYATDFWLTQLAIWHITQ